MLTFPWVFTFESGLLFPVTRAKDLTGLAVLSKSSLWLATLELSLTYAIKVAVQNHLCIPWAGTLAFTCMRVWLSACANKWNPFLLKEWLKGCMQTWVHTSCEDLALGFAWYLLLIILRLMAARADKCYLLLLKRSLMGHLFTSLP